MYQPDDVANRAHGQLKTEKVNISLSPFAPENFFSRGGFCRPVPSRVSLVILHTQARTGTGEYYFPCSADHEQDWQPYPVDPYSAICDDHTYIHTQTESGAYSQDSSRFPRRHPFIYTANRHSATPEFIRLWNCVPVAFTAESPPAQGQ